MGRKSIWDTPVGNAPAAPETQPGWGEQVVPAETPVPLTPRPVVEQMRLAEKKKRNRGWEKQGKNRPTSFRGVPPKLQAEVRQVAEELQVTVDDVGRAFLEFAWRRHCRGELPVNPTLSRQRLTLFPEPDNLSGVRRPGWFERVWETPTAPAAGTGKNSRKKNAEQESKPWQWPKVNYRGLPEELVTAIRQLHEQRMVPVGEIITLFLGHSLEAYRSGQLILDPQPRIETGLTCQEKGSCF